MGRSAVSTLALLAPLLVTACSNVFSSYDAELTVAADEVTRLATAQRVERLAVIDLAAADDRSTQLGRYLADGLSSKLGIRADTLDFALCSRDRIGDLLAELKLEGSGLVDPEQATKVGSLCGAEVVVVGRYWILGERLEAKFDLLQTETGRQIGSAELNAPLATELRRMDTAAQAMPQPLLAAAPSPRPPPETHLPQHFACDPFSLTLLHCRFEGDDLFCRLELRNDATGRRTVRLDGGSLLVDNGRDAYKPSRIVLGAESVDLVHGGEVLGYELPANTTFNLRLDFHTISRRERKAQILVVDLSGHCKAEFRDFFFSRDQR